MIDATEKLKDLIIEVFDMRPSMAELCMAILANIKAIVENEEMKRMNDSINRQAAIEVVKRYLVDCHVEDADWHGNSIEYELKDLPPAQQWIPIILCKDCMFYLEHRCQATRGLDDWRNQDDYCSKAERRTDE